MGCATNFAANCTHQNAHTQVVEAVEALEDIRATLFDLQSDAGEGHQPPWQRMRPVPLLLP